MSLAEQLEIEIMCNHHHCHLHEIIFLCMERLKSFFLVFQKKARIAFSDQEGRNELLGGEDSQSSEDQVILMSKIEQEKTSNY